MVPSILLSALVRRFERADLAAFTAAYPNAWLVWEPGSWKPPSRQGTMQLPAFSAARPEAAAGGEALAFALVLPKGATQLTVGRADGNDIVVNDATLSSVHLVLAWSEGTWTVRDAGSSNGSTLDGGRLFQGNPLPLRPGATLRAAQVLLTYFDARAMFARVQAQAMFAAQGRRP